MAAATPPQPSDGEFAIICARHHLHHRFATGQFTAFTCSACFLAQKARATVELGAAEKKATLVKETQKERNARIAAEKKAGKGKDSGLTRRK